MQIRNFDLLWGFMNFNGQFTANDIAMDGAGDTLTKPTDPSAALVGNKNNFSSSRGDVRKAAVNVIIPISRLSIQPKPSPPWTGWLLLLSRVVLPDIFRSGTKSL